MNTDFRIASPDSDCMQASRRYTEESKWELGYNRLKISGDSRRV